MSSESRLNEMDDEARGAVLGWHVVMVIHRSVGVSDQDVVNEQGATTRTGGVSGADDLGGDHGMGW